MLQLYRSQQLVGKHQLLQGAQTVDGAGGAAHLAAGKGVYAAALLQLLAPADAVLHVGGQQGGLEVLLVYLVDAVVLDHVVLQIVELLCLELVVELLPAAHFAQALTGQRSETRAGIGAAVDGAFQHLHGVGEGGAVAAAALAGDGGLYAAHDAVAPGVIQRIAHRHHGGDDGLVIVEGGIADAGAYALGALLHEAVRGAVEHADGQQRLDQPGLLGGGHADVGQVVDAVAPGVVLTGDGQVGVCHVAHKGLGVVDITELGLLVQLDIQGADQLQGALLRQRAGLQLLLVVGVQQLIQTAHADAVAVGLQLNGRDHRGDGL